MAVQNEVLIQLNNASFRYPGEDYIFEDVKLTVKRGDKTAIVGINGIGKSTLLKLLTGALKLEEGEQSLECKAYYVPQVDFKVNQEDLRIYEYIEKYYENWWDIPSEVEKLFGLTIDTEDYVKKLSGGEIMKLNLAIALKHNPDVLVLDEPTNHLDVKSLNALIRFIKSPTGSRYTYLIVSHDVFFMNSVVTKIWELDSKTITTYGGNYDFYIEQKELQMRAIKRQYHLAEVKLEKAKESEQKELERQARRTSQAKLAFIKGSMDTTEFSEGKNAASASLKNKNATLERLRDEAEEKLEEYDTEERKLAFINIQNTNGNQGRTIFELKNTSLDIDTRELIKEMNLKVGYGDRLVICGDNGTGKTTLVKALLHHGDKNVSSNKNSDIKLPHLEGDVYVGDKFSWVYIDQHYSLIKPELNLIENLMAYHNSFTEDKAKEQLGKFKFRTKAELAKLGKSLSGGEMVRLVMAMITAFPVDLVILDEPTNNLDVATVEVLVKSLNFFKGSIMVISHNIDFLHKINVEKAYIIKNKKLKLMEVSPENKEAFYKALSD